MTRNSIMALVLLAAVCINEPNLPSEYAKSFSVITATVISQRHVPPLDKFFDLDGDMYTIKVEEVFRGKLPRTVELFSENSSGRFPMTVGAKYILFIYREHGRLMVDNCGNSALLTEGSATVAAVRKLSGSKKPN